MMNNEEIIKKIKTTVNDVKKNIASDVNYAIGAMAVSFIVGSLIPTSISVVAACVLYVALTR